MKPEILYGIHPVTEAIRAGRRKMLTLFLAEKGSPRLASLTDLAGSAGIPVEKRSAADLNAMAGAGGHQGVAARVGPFPLPDLSAPQQVTDLSDLSGGPPFLLLLDSILDPQNLGALLRTAVCAGVDGVILPKNRSAAPSPAVSKASAGALEHARLFQTTNLVRAMEMLKAAGLWITGLDRSGDRSIYRCDFTGPVALVIGGEEKGIRHLVKQHCDFLATIPQAGPIDSLNASAAGAVALYEAFRQRHPDRTDGQKPGTKDGIS
jgi:23S rRNA (guanosine2251-2'-O)-methyltransferase